MLDAMCEFVYHESIKICVRRINNSREWLPLGGEDGTGTVGCSLGWAWCEHLFQLRDFVTSCSELSG